MSYTIITGATGGLGKAISIECAQKGYNLILTGRSSEKLLDLFDCLTKIRPNIDIRFFPCDLSSVDDRCGLFNSLIKNNLSIERVIHVAGVDTQMALKNYTHEKLIFQSRVNLEAVFDLTLFALKNKVDRLEVLTISSICAAVPIGYFSVYSSTKAALKHFFDSLRLEYKNKEVTFTTVLPGSIITRADIIADIEKQGLQGRLSKKTPEYVAKKALKALERRRKNYVPGFYNKIVYFFSKVTPRSISSKITTRKFSHKEKDSF